MKRNLMGILWLVMITAGILVASTPLKELPETSETVQQLSLTPQERLQLQLMKAEYNNLTLAVTIKGMQIQEWIRETREGKGLGPEFLLDEKDMMYKPTETFDAP